MKESLVEEAIAKAYEVLLADVKRANMLLGDIAETVRLASDERLAEARMRLFHPIGFMLATPAESAGEAFEKFTSAIVEDKYDGIRAQVHVSPAGDGRESKVKIVFSNAGRDQRIVPVGSFAGRLRRRSDPGRRLLAWREGEALAFSALQKRLGRKRVTEKMIEEIPVGSYISV